jgi:aryl-alcohol dehydrogenase-like predicted oxidoreductase
VLIILSSQESNPMAHDETTGPDRRTFLQAGALATASALSVTAGLRAQDAPEKPKPLPTRKLGRTGVEVTVLDQGGVRGAVGESVIRIAYAAGVRVFDTAKAYGTEGNFKKWFEQMPEIRKSIFLVTKDELRSADRMIQSVDERLVALGTDYIDLFFIHGLGDPNTGGVDNAINLVKSAEFKTAADTIRKSGKAKFIGFSTHHKDRAKIIQAAAEGGVVDAIMLMYNPWIAADSEMNKALDVCHEKGVGLISMKQTAGKFFGDRTPRGKVLEDIARTVPVLKEKNLSPFQGLLHAIWTDERISAVCTSMKNRDEIRENIDAAHRYTPLKIAEVEQLRDAVLAHNPMMCADCDGRCSIAAGTNAELGNLTRFLTYHEHHGDRSEARRQYAALAPEARDWSGADLEAAREACPNKLNFAKLLPEVDRYLA